MGHNRVSFVGYAQIPTQVSVSNLCCPCGAFSTRSTTQPPINPPTECPSCCQCDSTPLFSLYAIFI